MKPFINSAFAALALTGCVSVAPRPLSESHPANPRAPQSPDPAPILMLVAGAQGLVLPVSTNQMEMQHGEHQQTPAAKDTQQPAEHKHEHEQPKQEEKK